MLKVPEFCKNLLCLCPTFLGLTSIQFAEGERRKGKGIALSCRYLVARLGSELNRSKMGDFTPPKFVPPSEDTVGKSIKCKAAIAFAAKEPLKVCEVEVSWGEERQALYEFLKLTSEVNFRKGCASTRR